MAASKNKYHFVFITVFALTTTAALFSLLSLLIDFQFFEHNLQASTSTAIKTYTLTKGTPKGTPAEQEEISQKISNKPQQPAPKNKPAPEEDKSSSIVSAKPKVVPNPAPNAKAQVVGNKEPKAKANHDAPPADESLAAQTDIVIAETDLDATMQIETAAQATAISSPTEVATTADKNPMEQIADKLATTVFDAKNLKKIYSPAPKYPRRARNRNIQGWVLTEFKIRKDGSVDKIKVVDGKNTSFFKSEVIKTLALWRFEKQYPYEIQASMRFVFTLQG
ncbi:MAG: energy transducer TonB [Gammaproteobacteria bacterium]|nr:MAG: energy transducer TonB [Gammaproteobacteria bacterium]